jgi:signal transduction histidine kinase/CheY-like chemotaxis protein
MRAILKNIILGLIIPYSKVFPIIVAQTSGLNNDPDALIAMVYVNTTIQLAGVTSEIDSIIDSPDSLKISEAYFSKGQQLMAKYSVNAGRQCLKKALPYCPDNAFDLKAKVFNLLGESYLKCNQLDSARLYLDNVYFRKAKHPIDKEIMLNNQYLMAWLYIYLQEADRASKLTSALKNDSTNNYSLADIDLLNGKVHVSKGNYDSAFHYYHNALLKYESSFNALGQGKTYEAFGDLLHTFYDHLNALEYYFKALENIEPGNYLYDKASILIKVADAYLHINEYQLAVKYALKTQSIAMAENYDYGIGKSALIIGQVATYNRNFAKAEKELAHAYAMFEKCSLQNELLNTRLKQLLLFVEKNDLKRSKYLAEKLSDYNNTINQPLQQWEYNHVFNLYYLMQGDIEGARKIYKNFVHVNGRSSIQVKYKNMMEAYINYRNNLSANELQEKQQALSKVRAEVRIQQWIIYTLVVATLVILVFMIIIYRFYRRNRNANQELVQKNIEININRGELLVAKNKAEESDRLKSAFLTNMSHEIRTPMNSIIGFSKLLGSENLDMDKRRKYNNVIESNGRALVNLIDEIIDLSKLKSNQLKLYPENCYLHKELESIFDEFKHELENYNKSHVTIRLNFPGDHQVETFSTDIRRLKQVLSNLLFNAIKFTKDGSIEFGYECINDMIRFYVKDTGIGIAHHAKDIIFKQFRQIDGGENREYGGTGHGLSLCEGLINLMGGEIWVESELHKGTTFFFNLPSDKVRFYDTDALAEAGEVQGKDYNWIQKTILIAEDEEENYILLEEILAETEIDIQRAYDGQEVVNMVKGGQPIDVIVMDIKMPVMDGYEATRRIKALNKKIPVIAQTAYASSDEHRLCIEAGCDSYISKPFKPQELLLTIHQFITPSPSPETK